MLWDTCGECWGAEARQRVAMGGLGLTGGNGEAFGEEKVPLAGRGVARWRRACQAKFAGCTAASRAPCATLSRLAARASRSRRLRTTRWHFGEQNLCQLHFGEKSKSQPGQITAGNCGAGGSSLRLSRHLCLASFGG